ncbi:P1 family peptidase [Calderihabitans maritimus]|uniref:Peptidase S58 family protein n=1 Tax=Calderihabitans maritimus TaxID=1246530 RepID=A0A1Z5HTN2_9FIRM|nr:P1 family peptidase [Calderihabitans maritimus]GAW92884.1 peptidase S58 family protein [Calderihabitans maritimus]
MYRNITDIPGIKVGHATDEAALTGCTVVLMETGATAGADIRGSAPGTRETDLLQTGRLVNRIHGIVLTGGSAFGLDAAGGVMRYLEERGIGFDTGVARVPIVPAAVLFDLHIGDPKVRPDWEMGYRACLDAKEGPLPEGNVGAGTGATVGKLMGIQWATKAGIGNWSERVGSELIIGALVAVNALGEVIDENGQILAGLRQPEGSPFVSTLEKMKEYQSRGFTFSNTTLAVVATNARLSKEEVNKVAQMAHNGLARSIRPVHTMYDGDTVFAVSLGEVEADVSLVGSMAAEVLAKAVRRAVLCAQSAGGVPAASELKT